MATVTAPPERWAELGALLEARRVEVDPAYRNRTAFAADTGLNARFISDLEKGRRHSYRDLNLRAAEQGYRVATGSFERFLSGETEDLEPLPPAQDESADAGPLSASEAQGPDDEEWDGYLVGEPHLRPGESLRWKRLAPRRGQGRIRYVLDYTDPDTGLQDNPDTIFSDERDVGFVLQYFRELRDQYPDAQRRDQSTEQTPHN